MERVYHVGIAFGAEGAWTQADLNEALKWAMQPMNLYRLTMEWKL